MITPRCSGFDATPFRPYKVVDNTAGCLLNVTDEVFIDPIGTGFSKAVGKAEDKQFWGIDEDVNSLGQFITSYVTRNNRWNSPKFLIGVQLRHVQVRGAINHLQSQGMDFNGVVMISTVLRSADARVPDRRSDDLSV